ncbi:ABC transporter substrate-binding protein [Dactylosporangium sp. CA-092794]|uniref:ABC transporter substrate-binding protein n=1 Tax=Dactylosporangium sp. CA-092794 TaxID=3239929 RepID=UPI003D917702
MAKIGKAGQADIEKIAALKPDLILGVDYGTEDKLYPKLTQIAPTAYFSFTTTGQWEQVAAGVTDAVGRGSRNSELAAAYRSTAASLRTTHQRVIDTTTWAIVNGMSDAQFTLWLPGSDAGQVLTAIGGRFVPAAAGDGDSLTLSVESLDRLADADVIVIGADASGAPYPATKTLTEQPGWGRLPAAEAGHVYPLATLFPFSYPQAEQLLAELDQVCARLGGTP